MNPVTVVKLTMLSALVGASVAIAQNTPKLALAVNQLSPIPKTQLNPKPYEGPITTIDKFFALVNKQDTQSLLAAKKLLHPSWKISDGQFLSYWSLFDAGKIQVYSTSTTRFDSTHAKSVVVWYGRKQGKVAGGQFTWYFKKEGSQWLIVAVQE